MIDQHALEHLFTIDGRIDNARKRGWGFVEKSDGTWLFNNPNGVSGMASDKEALIDVLPWPLITLQVVISDSEPINCVVTRVERKRGGIYLYATMPNGNDLCVSVSDEFVTAALSDYKDHI